MQPVNQIGFNFTHPSCREWLPAPHPFPLARANHSAGLRGKMGVLALGMGAQDCWCPLLHPSIPSYTRTPAPASLAMGVCKGTVSLSPLPK